MADIPVYLVAGFLDAGKTNFINGILEQLILYPSLVGNAIGLTTLETIIVVLLGGLFAGITGMIFAVPAAAVIKYLIPKIYSVWTPGKQ